MSAALFAILACKVSLLSGIGIVCGWQPMPDGSASYECVVQVEPQLLESLKRGDSIPLSVEVPEHVQPIKRIRLIVGHGHVPQQLLATSSPAAPKKPLDGVVQTQFTTSNNATAGGYTNQAQGTQIVPVNEYVTNAQDAFARSLQNGGQSVQNAVTQMTQDVLPPDAGRSMAKSVESAGQQLGDNLRNASETVTQDIRQMFGAEPAAEKNAEILPPGGQAPPRYDNQPSQPISPPDNGTADNRRRLDQPINSSQIGDWQSREIPTTNPVSPTNTLSNKRETLGSSRAAVPSGQQGAVATTSPTSAQNNNGYGTAPQFSASTTNILPQNNGGQNSTSNNSPNRYGNVASPPGNVPTTSAGRGIETANNQSAPTGPSFPSFTPLATDQSITPTPQSSGNVAEVRRGMLSQPANAEIQGANGLPIGQQPISPQTVSEPGTSATSTDFGWNTKPQAQQTVALPAGIQTATSPVFPLLLSWVLLSGSGAGNLYLFWSYLDVRNKYRDLVYDGSRKVRGGRVRD